MNISTFLFLLFGCHSLLAYQSNNFSREESFNLNNNGERIKRDSNECSSAKKNLDLAKAAFDTVDKTKDFKIVIE